MIFPAELKKGDTIGLVAPSSPEVPVRIDACQSLLARWGYHVKLGESIYDQIHGYSAGTGARRAADLQRMFADPKVKAIFCLRGGDTSSHILEFLDVAQIRANPKIFVGYSDITNLHVVFNQQADLITFHGPMVSPNMLESYDIFTQKSFQQALALGRTGSLILANPTQEPFQVIRPGQAAGLVVGGNLSLLCSQLGTPYEVNTAGKILFFEDVRESTRHVDRMLYHLKYSGKLAAAAGVLVGDFARQFNDQDPAYLADQLIRDFFADYSKPVIANVKSGHCRPMSTIPLGAHCIMSTQPVCIRFHAACP